MFSAVPHPRVRRASGNESATWPLTDSPLSLERCLTQPVALRPDDVLEGILIRFLANLKPGIKQLR